jgi:hypothetical protein
MIPVGRLKTCFQERTIYKHCARKHNFAARRADVIVDPVRSEPFFN